MKNSIKQPQQMALTFQQHKRFHQYLIGDDLDFYEEFILNQPPKVQQNFFDMNPNFMSDYPVNKQKINLLSDTFYRKLLRNIKLYEKYNQ